MADKYVVFKRDEFHKIIETTHVYSMTEKLLAAELDNFVVIRLGDAFASAALHTYANSIAITAKTIGELAPSTRDRLQGIADYFYEQATLADDMASKLPD